MFISYKFVKYNEKNNYFNKNFINFIFSGHKNIKKYIIPRFSIISI